MNITLDNRFKKKLGGRFGKYSFEVGILRDKRHRPALRGEPGQKGRDVLGFYAGGPVRKARGGGGDKMISEVARELIDRTGINFWTEPFNSKRHSSGAQFSSSVGNADILKFTNEFFKMAFGKSEKRRAETLLQAIVRNPILRGEYMHNSPLTTRIKGFDRFMIDTGQLFKAIEARCTVRGR